jgi:hypothetical protein
MEAKASAVIIGALPFIVATLVYLTSPALHDDPVHGSARPSDHGHFGRSGCPSASSSCATWSISTSSGENAMSSDLARLTDPSMLIAVLVALAVFASFYTLAMPFFERGDLNKRMKAVSTEREQIRARERARMNAEATGSKASLRNQNNRSVRQIVERSICAKRWSMKIP